MSSWFFNVYTDTMMKEVQMGMEMRSLKEGRESRLPALLYTGDLVLHGESEKGLRAMVGHFVGVCNRGDLRINIGRSMRIVLNGKYSWSVRFVWMRYDWRMCQNLNTLGVFWMNQV